MRAALATAIGGALVAGSLAAAPGAQAQAGCVSQPWLVVLRMTVRTICDSPRNPDGSWERRRLFYAPEYWSSGYCTRYTCTLGHWVPEYSDFDQYHVTPDTVLPDEPGWIA